MILSDEELWTLGKLCQKFVIEQDIWSPETIYQSDRVIENAYKLIQDICDIVGYVPCEDDEEDDDE